MKKLIQLFFTFSRGKQIAVSVILVHLLVLFCLTGHHLVTCRWRTPRPMVIKMISPLAPLAKKVIASKEITQKSQPPAEKNTVAPTAASKKTAAPVASAKKESKISTSVKGKPAQKTVEKSVLKEIAESIDAISSEPKKSFRSPLNVPVKAAPKLQETPVEEDDATYEEYLIAFLQTALDLPEFGEVKMEIEIDSYGKLVDCKILDSKSRKNAEFLRKEIVALNFPVPLGSHKFTIVFRNQ